MWVLWRTFMTVPVITRPDCVWTCTYSPSMVAQSYPPSRCSVTRPLGLTALTIAPRVSTCPLKVTCPAA